MAERNEYEECQTCYDESFKKAIEKRNENERNRTKEELEQLNLLKESPVFIKCSECGMKINPWIGCHYIQSCKCGHSWSLVKGF